MASNYVPQVDYTSRDYAAIRDDLLALIPSFLPEWTNTDASDFGVTLIELFAYMGDILNYYIDRAANESFIATATQRSSVLAIANLLGYTPSSSIPATVTLSFQNYNSTSVNIPALTQVATTKVVNGSSTQIIFEVDYNPATSDGSWPVSANSSASVTATQGVTWSNEYIGDSDGTASQTFALQHSVLINGSTSVTAAAIKYSAISYLIDAGFNDPVYTVATDADGNSTLTFGDNISGRIPPIGPIYATYRTGGGAIGNVGPGTLNSLVTGIAGVQVNNPNAAAGGADEESTDSIRYNAPFALQALNRTVSLKDYGALAVQVSSVAKAVADAQVYNSVLVYIAPSGDTSLGTPGVDATGNTNTYFTSASTDLYNYLTDKSPATTSITILPPVYVPINISLNLYVQAKNNQKNVSDAVYAGIQNFLNFNSTYFAENFVPGFIHSVVGQTIGTQYADITLLSAGFNGTLTAGSATITGVTNFNHVTVGNTITTASALVTIPSGTTISSVNTSAGTITMSANAVAGTASSAPYAVIYPTTNSNVQCATNEIPIPGTITITATGGV